MSNNSKKRWKEQVSRRLRRIRALEVWRFEPELDGYRERLESLIDALHPRIPDRVLLYDLHVWRKHFGGWPSLEAMVEFWSPWLKGDAEQRLKSIRSAYSSARSLRRMRAQQAESRVARAFPSSRSRGESEAQDEALDRSSSG